jgi:hypothetical protein
MEAIDKPEIPSAYVAEVLELLLLRLLLCVDNASLGWMWKADRLVACS